MVKKKCKVCAQHDVLQFPGGVSCLALSHTSYPGITTAAPQVTERRVLIECYSSFDTDAAEGHIPAGCVAWHPLKLAK
jgi:hypothetical protein